MATAGKSGKGGGNPNNTFRTNIHTLLWIEWGGGDGYEVISLGLTV